MDPTIRLLDCGACRNQSLRGDLATESSQWRSRMAPTRKDVAIDPVKVKPFYERVLVSV